MIPSFPILAGGKAATPEPARLLDIYSGAVAAYSVARRLKGSAGLALRVRQSGDSYATAQDVGFASDQLDTTTLTGFVGANTGVIEAIYDQVGTSTLAQGTNANRPTIIAAGALHTLGTNTKPSVVFDSTDLLETSSARPNFGGDLGLDGNAAWSVFMVHRKTTNTAGALFGWGNTAVSLAAAGVFDDGTVNNVSWSGGNDFKLNVASNNTHYLTSVFKAAGAINATTAVYRNGASVAASGHSTATPNVAGGFPLQMARWANSSSSGLQGDVQELIVFAGDKSSDRAAIEAQINAFYGIF